jgi:hypothetical protein
MKKSLRQLCLEEYGEDFVEEYDKVCRGIPIGGLLYTVCFIDMVEEVKEKYKGQWEQESFIDKIKKKFRKIFNE